MANDDLRYYETFYGIHTDNWEINFGLFSSHKKILTKDYINEGCSTTDTSTATATDNKFIYPHHIKKKYWIEGVITGQITIGASGCTSTVTSYRVTVCKMHENNDDDELFSTGWITVNDTLDWDNGLSVGDEMVYPFWIDAWRKRELSDKEKIYVKVEVKADVCAFLWHSNDATWEDLKIEIPLRM